MSVTGSGIPAGTVVASTNSSAGTITLSKAATAGNYTGSVSLTIFNGTGAVLPIKFSAVAATLQHSAALVTWQVADESNVVRYIVEKQVPGRQFEQVATILAGKKALYSFTDQALAAGINLYRIKAQSPDGQFKYSSIVKVANTKNAIKLQLYPNPATNEIAVSGLQPNDQISIVDNSGRVVKTIQNNNAHSTSTFNVSSLATGAYLLVVKNLGQQQAIAFIKQ